ncbi:hypothetical protein GYMLUDRAFT_85636 [Collybiopsis luxurians FD-317 M1]|uniref:Uncharacterized protein n=1 Tax=Collybiopsis luxurians FD-317 M1 TaxID=944289 RepID=A0A0D0CM85_9AGAR|nr:hypothetical protein GYMLUDRAFT_85636 [Collybiopsis luxurians FD-317 M1]
MLDFGGAPAPPATIMANCMTVSSNIPKLPEEIIDDGVDGPADEALERVDEVVVVEANEDDDEKNELLEVLAEAGARVCEDEVDGGGKVEEGGSYVDAGVSEVEELSPLSPESKSQLPYRTPTSSEAKNWNRLVEKSRPPYGQPGHYDTNLREGSTIAGMMKY